jgi:hypothetical protein
MDKTPLPKKTVMNALEKRLMKEALNAHRRRLASNAIGDSEAPSPKRSLRIQAEESKGAEIA